MADFETSSGGAGATALPLIVTNEESPGVDIEPGASGVSAGFSLPGDPYAAGVGFGVVSVCTFRPTSGPGFFSVASVLEYSLDGGGSWLYGAGADIRHDMSWMLLGTAYQVVCNGIVDAGAIAVPLQVRTNFTVHPSSAGDVRWQRVQTICTQGIVSAV